MAIVHMGEPERMRQKIGEKAAEWHGAHTDKMSMAVGYASAADHPGATVDDLEHMADADMYAEKDRHYREAGIDRRQR